MSQVDSRPLSMESEFFSFFLAAKAFLPVLTHANVFIETYKAWAFRRL